VTPFSVPFQLDPTIVSEGMSASMLNSYYRDNWVSGETLTYNINGKLVINA